MFHKKSEKGQALIIIVFAIIGLIGITGLAVDGGRTFVDRQSAQTSSDSAALGTALANIKNAQQTTPLTGTALTNYLTAAAKAVAGTNGYAPDTVTVETKTTTAGSLTTAPFTNCNGTTSTYTDTKTTTSTYIQVKIVTNVDTSFAKLVGINQMSNCVESIARSRLTRVIPLFDGNAIVAVDPVLSPSPPEKCGFDSGGSADLELTGGGLFANGCLKQTTGTLDIPTDKCVTSVGSATVDDTSVACVHQNQTAEAYAYPTDIDAMMPPDPCILPITAGRYASGGKVPAVGQTSFSNDVFCITDPGALGGSNAINLTHATLYIMPPVFEIKFTGTSGSGFSGTGTVAGAYTGSENYAGYYMIVKRANTPCTSYTSTTSQVIDFRGNGAADITGTVFAPSACIDYRGNSGAQKTESQIIGYKISTSGSADLEINYDQTKNGQRTIQSNIELTK